METAAVHALQHDDVAARIDDAARDRDLGLAGLVDGDSHYLSSAVMGQTLGVGDVHGMKFPGAERELWASRKRRQGEMFNPTSCRTRRIQRSFKARSSPTNARGSSHAGGAQPKRLRDFDREVVAVVKDQVPQMLGRADAADRRREPGVLGRLMRRR